VHWRTRADERALRRRERMWTLTSVAHTIPFLATAALLTALKPLAAPVAAVALVKAYVIPALYARRGANVIRPKRRGTGQEPGAGATAERLGATSAAAEKLPATSAAGAERLGAITAAERRALGFLGDLVDHDARELLQRSGLVLEEGGLGVWLVGEAGALLVRPGGRTVMCWCVRVPDPDLPWGDRIAHLLLALRTDEQGFATVANLAFSGGRWRVRRKLPVEMRPALAEAIRVASR
jgi:hypothetical protein